MRTFTIFAISIIIVFENRSFDLAARQECSDMIVFAEWKSTYQKHFFDSREEINDYGKCCGIVPQIDFEDMDGPSGPGGYILLCLDSKFKISLIF